MVLDALEPSVARLSSPARECVMCIKILILLRIKNYALVKGVSII